MDGLVYPYVLREKLGSYGSKEMPSGLRTTSSRGDDILAHFF